METSYSVRFIGHYLLTFRSSRGKILSKSVMPPWPAVSCHGVRDFAFYGLSGSPRALSSASVRGLFLCPQPCKNRGSVRGWSQLQKAAPRPRFFGRLTMRLLSTGPHPPHNEGRTNATKSGLLLRSP